jgi:hypothetical protein
MGSDMGSGPSLSPRRGGNDNPKLIGQEEKEEGVYITASNSLLRRAGSRRIYLITLIWFKHVIDIE